MNVMWSWVCPCLQTQEGQDDLMDHESLGRKAKCGLGLHAANANVNLKGELPATQHHVFSVVVPLVTFGVWTDKDDCSNPGNADNILPQRFRNPLT